MSTEIQIADEFTEDDGQFTNYDAIPLNQREQLKAQKHVDIRLFNDEILSASVTMLALDTLTLFQLNQLKMNQLSLDDNAQIILSTGENWSAGTVARQADRNHWRGISLACTTAGPNITQSVMA